MKQNPSLDPAAAAQQDPFTQAPPAETPAEQVFPVTFAGETRELTRDALITAAESGLSKQNAYIRRNRAAGGLSNGQIYAAFVEEYPDVRPEDIPQQVWEWAQAEGSLVAAYRKWELLELKDQLAAVEQNVKNRKASVGPAKGDGEPAGVDPVTLALLGR